MELALQARLISFHESVTGLRFENQENFNIKEKVTVKLNSFRNENNYYISSQIFRYLPMQLLNFSKLTFYSLVYQQPSIAQMKFTGRHLVSQKK